MKKHQKHSLDFNYIDEGIYIGTNKCCQTHFDETLIKEGITADISLQEESIDVPLGVEFYVWIPVKDDTAPTHAQFEFGVSVLEKMVEMKKKVYVHCLNGHGRAPTLVAAYFIKRGRDLGQALAFIKSKRTSMHLEKVQIKALEEWSNTIKRL